MHQPSSLRVKLTGLPDPYTPYDDPSAGHHELCLIDAGVKSMLDVPLSGHNIQTLNLHCNHIRQIENLQASHTLRHLDLSSNQICYMRGLETLASLRTLNLACNQIETITGLAGLRSLTRLNLSYNNIVELHGLCDLHGPDYQLSHLELQGNQIHSVEHLITSLRGLHHLTDLTLMHDGSSNPVCELPGYRASVLHSLPQLRVLDGHDRNGKQVVKQGDLDDIPGLEQYLDYLLTSESSATARQESIMNIVTPRIDQALEKFRKRAVMSSDVTTSATTDTDGNPRDDRIRIHRKTGALKDDRQPPDVHVTMMKQSSLSTKPVSDHERRLEQLEQQLADILERRLQTTTGPDAEPNLPRKTGGIRKKGKVAKRDTDFTDESDEENRQPREVEKRHSRAGRVSSSNVKTHQAGSKQQKPTSRAKLKEQTSKSFGKTRQTKNPSDGTTTSSPPSGSGPDRHQKASRVVPTTADQDAEKLILMQELDGERERRWKAEQAAIRLADHIKDLQSKAQEERELNDVAIQATTRLKHALMNEKETKSRLEEQLQLCMDQIKALSTSLETSQKSEEEQRKTLHAMESTATKMESERLQHQAHDSKRLTEYQMRAAAVGRELDLVKTQCKQQEGKIQQLQELLANREQEHRHQVDDMYRLNSPEIQNVIQREMNREKERQQQENKLYQERIQTLTKQYSELENEFRMALQIEAERFNELQGAYQRISHESASSKQNWMSVSDKEKRASVMVTELTAMVKEQKGRLTEISKSKHDIAANSKERINTLETQLEEARRRLVQMEVLKQEKTRLASQIVAQESVMEGLKAERKLWGQELAQQGASLAQDRGRLEARIEALSAEVISLKKQSERENDALKIKTKVVDDQTDTIRKLKEGLLERDSQVKGAREELIQVQRDLEDQVATEQSTNHDLSEQVDRLTERKEELKQQMADIQAECEESKRAYRALDNKWKEKGQLIDQLEGQVRQVKKTFDDKELSLKEERDKALKAEKLIAEKMKSMDDAFCQQLQAAEISHRETLQQMTREREETVQQANQRVLQVEEEMRQLLAESANQKKQLEAKLRRLTQAFGDLQQDFT